MDVTMKGGKPGDWICPQCQHLNFARNQSCNKCGNPSTGVERLGAKPGDWLCPNCGDLVFASRDSCKMCGTSRGDATEEPTFAGGAPAGQMSENGQFAKPGDWLCPKCGDLVFEWKDACRMCGTPKVNGALEAQDGVWYAAGKGRGKSGFRPGDWMCPGCGDNVFAWRSECKMCGIAKPADANGCGTGRAQPY